jgi:hypothetical protein
MPIMKHPVRRLRKTHSPRRASSGYYLPACVVLWSAVMVGARTARQRTSVPHIARHMLTAAFDYERVH